MGTQEWQLCSPLGHVSAEAVRGIITPAVISMDKFYESHSSAPSAGAGILLFVFSTGAYSFVLEEILKKTFGTPFVEHSVSYWLAGGYGSLWLTILFFFGHHAPVRSRRFSGLLKGLEYGLVSSVAAAEFAIMAAAIALALTVRRLHPSDGGLADTVFYALIDYGTYGMVVVLYLVPVGAILGLLGSLILSFIPERFPTKTQDAGATARALAVEGLSFSMIGLPIAWLIVPGGVFSAIGGLLAVLSILRLKKVGGKRIGVAVTGLVCGLGGVVISLASICSVIFYQAVSR